MVEIESESQITYLIVEPGTKTLVNMDNGKSASFRLISIARNNLNTPSPYSELTDLSRTERCRVLIRKSSELVDSRLPLAMCDRLAKYLASEHNRTWMENHEAGIFSHTQEKLLELAEGIQDKNIRRIVAWIAAQAVRPQKSTEEYDCGHFAHELNQVPYKDRSFDANLWEGEIWKKGQPIEPGTTLVLAETRINRSGKRTFWPTHMAISLIDGLSLSKFGAFKLGVSDLDSLIEVFGGDRIYAVTPRRQKNESV